MTAQLERQTDALVGANRQLEERRALHRGGARIGHRRRSSRSTATGSVAADEQLRAAAAARPRGPAPIGCQLDEIAPQIARAGRGRRQRRRSSSYAKGGELLTLAVKIAPATDGHVITFEDITRQLLDQRQAAWSDVARRIAHEIKNPLTPIQLATERLQPPLPQADRAATASCSTS